LKLNLDYIDSFISYLKVEKRYSFHTLQAYRTDLVQFEQYIDKEYELTFQKIKHTHIRSFVVSLMGNEVSNRSICRKLSALKSFYKFFIRSGEVKSSPMIQVQLPKTEKKLPTFVKEKDILSLFKKTESKPEFALMVNLDEQSLIDPSGNTLVFELEKFRKDALLNGLDEIGLTLSHAEGIRAFETNYQKKHPWLFTT